MLLYLHSRPLVGFMAPEVARCHHASPASDIWSLGCLLFMLLTGGVEPFWKPGRPAVTTQRKARRGEFSWPVSAKDHLSEDACDLVNNLLVVRPGDRLSAEEALQAPLASRGSVSPEEIDLRRPLVGLLACFTFSAER